MNPTWVYHPEFSAKIVSEAEANVLYREGWFDSPAKFVQADNPQGKPFQARRGRPPKNPNNQE